jgi:ethanolamine kinase
MYGYFNNGRIEGFFNDARPLEPSEMGQLEPRNMPKMIGTELARMHCLQIPEAKVPMLWTQIDSWMAQAQVLDFEAEDEATKKGKFATIDLKAVASDLEAVRALLPSSLNCDGVTLLDAGSVPGESAAQSRGRRAARMLLFEVVFSHNDVLSGNVLALTSDESRVQLIDFEYGGYNYAGFDMGNHFCEHAGFDFDLDKWYPNDGVAREFLQAYVARRMPDAVTAVAAEFEGADTVACEAAFWAEGVRVANMFALASHFFWGLWAVIQAKHSPIDFDFMQYAVERLVNGLGKHKVSFLQPELK